MTRARRFVLRRLTLPCLIAATACASEESAHVAEEARAAVRAATPEHFASLLRARYASEGACVEPRFPAIVFLSPHDTSRAGRMGDEQLVRRYEVLAALGLVRREEVAPGDPDWSFAPSAHVDSGGTRRVVRYALVERVRPDAQREQSGAHDERLCYATLRLVAVDSVVMRGPSPSWSLGDGVRYSQASAFVRHRVALDGVADWARAVAERDPAGELGVSPSSLVDGEERWAEFMVRDGGWMYVGTRRSGPP